MESNLEPVDFELAREKEKEFRHDVMAHIHTFGEVCPKARPIIHLGATSCFVTDNTELIQMRESLQLIRRRMARLLKHLRDLAFKA